MKLLFLDAETTGLDPVIHVPWEVAAVLAEHTDDGRLVELASYEAMIDVGMELPVADPVGLLIGGFAERYNWEFDLIKSPGEVAAGIDALCDDRPHLVGAVPSFDDRRVGDLLRRCGRTPRWHYHLIDVETLAVGSLTQQYMMNDELDGAILAEWKSDELSLAIGVDPEKFERHTAMGDVRWCMAQYVAVFGLTQEVGSHG